MYTVVFRIAAEPTLWHCGKYGDDVCTLSRPCGCGERRDFSFFTVPLLGQRYGGGGCGYGVAKFGTCFDGKQGPSFDCSTSLDLEDGSFGYRQPWIS